MVSINDFKTLSIELDRVNSYIPPIIINEADNNGRHLKFTPTYEGQPVTGITSARMYYDPRPRDASSIGDYVDGTKDGDGWVFVLPPNTFTANVQGIASVSFTDEDGETYTRSMPIYVESGGTKADSQGTRIDRLIATLEQMVNDFTMTAEAETGEAGSQANVTVTKMNGGAYNLKFVIPRGDKGDTGDAATIQLGTVTTGNPGTSAEITNSGTENTAVFNFTIPRGDVGPAGVNENVPLGSTSGVVAQATDAYPALPRKVQVHGRTIENLWPAMSLVRNGVTLHTDETGLVTISGTEITGNAYFGKTVERLAAGKTYVGIVSATVANLKVRVQGVLPDAGSVSEIGRPFTTSGTTIQIPAGTTNIQCMFALEGMQSQTVNASFCVMLVEGDTVPDVFVPSGVNTVEPTKLIAAGKNLASVTSNPNYPNLLISDILPPGDYVFSAVGDPLERGYNLKANSLNGYDIVSDVRSQTTKFSLTQYASIYLNAYTGGSITNIQIEKGASATRFEQPVKRETNLPPDISLADGDTLTIDRDGTTQIVHAEGEPTVLDNVTLPELPDPTFNVYTTGGYIQPTVDVDYEKDVNLVLEALEAKIAALQVADKTN